MRVPCAWTPRSVMHVFCLKDDPDTPGLEVHVQPPGDLLGEPLLHLGRGSEVLNWRSPNRHLSFGRGRRSCLARPWLAWR
jgi:hypothetical protein